MDPDPVRDSYHRQNLVVRSLAHCQPSPKISCKSIRKFLRKVANRQTDRQTDRQTNNDDWELLQYYYLLGGGNNTVVIAVQWCRYLAQVTWSSEVPSDWYVTPPVAVKLLMTSTGTEEECWFSRTRQPVLSWVRRPSCDECWSACLQLPAVRCRMLANTVATRPAETPLPLTSIFSTVRCASYSVSISLITCDFVSVFLYSVRIDCTTGYCTNSDLVFF